MVVLYRRFGTCPIFKGQEVQGEFDPIFKGQEVQEDFLTLEDGTDRLYRNVGTELHLKGG